jgi:hypothetical protein
MDANHVNYNALFALFTKRDTDEVMNEAILNEHECEIILPVHNTEHVFKVKCIEDEYVTVTEDSKQPHLYYIFKINKFSDQLINFFNELKIPIEMIYLKRKSSIQNWCAIECELDEKNLKDYLQFQYTSLSHSDVEQIVSIVRENKFNFEVARMIGDLLNRMKQDRVEVEDRLFSLEQEDIAAATKLVINYFGINEQNLSLPSNLNFNSIKKSIEKLALRDNWGYQK